MHVRLVLIAPLALAACSKSPAQKAAAQIETAGSWTAAAAFAGEQWTQGLIPDQYARQVFVAASRSLGDTRTRLAAIGGERRASQAADSLIAPSLALVDSLGASVRRGDHASVTREAKPLENASRRLRAMKDSIDKAGT